MRHVVVPLRFNQFFDLQKLDTENFGSFKYNKDGERVSWIKIIVLRVNNDKENIIKFKYDFDDEHFMEINVKRNWSVERRNKNIVLIPKYTEKRAISIEKKADLISLCNSLVVPPIL